MGPLPGGSRSGSKVSLDPVERIRSMDEGRHHVAGDAWPVAEAVGRQFRVDEVLTEVVDKDATVAELQSHDLRRATARWWRGVAAARQLPLTPSARSRKAVTRAVHSSGAVVSAWVCDAPETVQVWTRSGAAVRR